MNLNIKNSVTMIVLLLSIVSTSLYAMQEGPLLKYPAVEQVEQAEKVDSNGNGEITLNPKIMAYFDQSALDDLKYTDELLDFQSYIKSSRTYYFTDLFLNNNSVDCFPLVRPVANYVYNLGVDKGITLARLNLTQRMNFIQRNPIKSVLGSFGLGAGLVGFAWWWKFKN
jgi:hypothetical protein